MTTVALSKGHSATPPTVVRAYTPKHALTVTALGVCVMGAFACRSLWTMSDRAFEHWVVPVLVRRPKLYAWRESK